MIAKLKSATLQHAVPKTYGKIEQKNRVKKYEQAVFQCTYLGRAYARLVTWWPRQAARDTACCSLSLPAHWSLGTGSFRFSVTLKISQSRKSMLNSYNIITQNNIKNSEQTNNEVSGMIQTSSMPSISSPKSSVSFLRLRAA